MEKTVNFSIFKEKIIKIDELLAILLEKNSHLDKAQKWNQHLKTKLDLTKNEVSKLHLRSDALQKNLALVEKDYQRVKNEHDKLKDEFVILETESSSTINNLQVKYQQTNRELEESKQEVTRLEKKLATDCSPVQREEESPIKTKRSPVRKRKICNKKENQNDQGMLMSKIYELQLEKEKLVGENDVLKSQIVELRNEFGKKEEQFLRENNNLKRELCELKNKNSVLPQLEDCLDDEQMREKDLELLNKIEKMKSDLDKLQSENKKIQEENSSYQIEIAMLLENKTQLEEKNSEIKTLLSQVEKLQKKNEKLQEENSSRKIEISMLQENQNLGEVVKENENQSSKANNGQPEVPNIEENNPRCNNPTPTDEEVSSILKEMIHPNHLLSPMRKSVLTNCHDNRILTPFDDSQPKDDNTLPNLTRETSPINSDLKNTMNRRRNLKRRRRLFQRKNSKHVDLFGALLALKKANINFIISSDSIVSSKNLPPPKFLRPKLKNKSFATATKELTCSLNCCKNTYMMVKDDSDEELLGFVEVKDETSREIFRIPSIPKRRRVSKIARIEEVEPHPSKPVPKRKKITRSTSGSEEDNFSKPAPKRKIVAASVFENDPEPVPPCLESEPDEGYCSYRKENSPQPELSDLTIKTRKCKRKSINSDNKEKSVIENSVNNKLELAETVKKPVVNVEKAKSPKTTFKRPVCSTRRSPRLIPLVEQNNSSDTSTNEGLVQGNPRSPSPPKSPTPCEEETPKIEKKPVLIPLDKIPENIEKMPTSKIEMLFNKLIVYSAEEEALNEVVREFRGQDPGYIAEAILERVALDYHDAPDTKYSPAPLMTDVQRTMLGFMSKLEKTNVIGVFDHYLSLAELRILTCKQMNELGPITRLYLAICKLEKNLTRMRKLCCDVFYFCGDLAMPFFFMVLTSWTEILPSEVDSKSMPIARVLVQIILTKDCNKPGYNFIPLRDLLNKFYGYPVERWDVNEFFKELFYEYLRNPVRSSDFALLLYCKNQSEKWVYDKIEEHLKPIVEKKIADNFKATIIILIGNLYKRFSSKSEVNYIPKIREWFSSLVTDSTPDVVKRSVYLCLNRLKKN